MKTAIAVIACVLMVGTFALADGPAVDHGMLDSILRENVRDERVDYLNIRDKRRSDLDGYLDQLATVKSSDLSRDEQFAFLINLYNATMIKAVIDRYHDGYKPSDDNFKVFSEPLVRLDGKTIALNDLENKVIRPTFKDPRVHVALVCGARSCPPILPRAYAASDLGATLDANMKRFAHDAYRNPIDVAGKKLKLSHLFDWYAADFGGPDAVPGYVGKYYGQDFSGFEKSFVDYDWSLNIVQK